MPQFRLEYAQPRAATFDKEVVIGEKRLYDFEATDLAEARTKVESFLKQDSFVCKKGEVQRTEISLQIRQPFATLVLKPEFLLTDECN